MQSQHSVHGIVLIDKPSGITSNQALGRIKRIFGIKKAGHTGTLDPMASGLLVVCLGHATRVAGHLINSDKAYQARIHLGVTTDTEDAEGTVMEQHPVPMLERSQVLDVLSGFVGEIQQVPPMYSALKHQGRRLYDLARKGQEVDRPARSIRIDELQLIEWHLDDQVAPGFSIEVRCSKGTYIRSLARDIGEALGCGAHLSFLRRTYADPFDLDEAITPDDLDALPLEESYEHLRPIESALPSWPQVHLNDDDCQRFCHGRAVVQSTNLAEGSLLAELDEQWVVVMHQNRCIGFGQLNYANQLQPKTVFHPTG
jgi:tRNA pseudouridine55 synthase